MPSDQDYVAGWLDSSISDFLNDLPDIVGSTKYSLITAVDSNLEPARLLEKVWGIEELTPQPFRPDRLERVFLFDNTPVLAGCSPSQSRFWMFDEVSFSQRTRLQPSRIPCVLLALPEFVIE